MLKCIEKELDAALPETAGPSALVGHGEECCGDENTTGGLASLDHTPSCGRMTYKELCRELSLPSLTQVANEDDVFVSAMSTTFVEHRHPSSDTVRKQVVRGTRSFCGKPWYKYVPSDASKVGHDCRRGQARAIVRERSGQRDGTLLVAEVEDVDAAPRCPLGAACTRFK